MKHSNAQAAPLPVAIRYIDGPRMRRALRAAIATVLADQEHLNKINVYPVPDGDTGTNLALTMHAILVVIGASREQRVGALLTAVADAAIDGARGNSGAILAQFLMGVADTSSGHERLDAAGLSAALTAGAAYARDAMTEPVEGTILTVLDDFAAAMSAGVQQGQTDISAIFDDSLTVARKSLARTPQLLDTLRRAGVVDAGAAGFVDMLTGISDLIREGVEREVPLIEPGDEQSSEPAAGGEIDLQYRYCTECLVHGEQIDRRRLREQMGALGKSLVIAGSHSRARIHIHTNEPDQVFEVAAQFGKVSAQKADDMRRQQELVHATARRVVIATDTGGDVPDDIAERLNIYQTSIRVHFGDKSYLDKVSITAQQLYDRLRNDEHPPKTSQPPPGDFRRQFQFLSTHYDEVISINLTSKASGTCQAAETAAQVMADERIRVIDSKNASLGQGLIVIDAAEAAAAGLYGEALRERIVQTIAQTRTYGALTDLSCAVRGGRVRASVKRFADILHLTPVLGNTRDGRIKPVGVLPGRDNVVEKFTRFIQKRVAADQSYRLAVGHADCEQQGRRLLAELERVVPNRHQTIFTRIGTALGVHTGPQGLVVGLQEYIPLPAIEDTATPD